MVSSNAASFTPKHDAKQICENYIRARCTYLSCTRSHVCLVFRGWHPEIKCLKPSHIKHSGDCIFLLLHNHSDTIFSNYVLFGMQRCFPIGHTAPLTREISSENHPSASRYIQFASDDLVLRCSEGQKWGPFHTPPFSHVQVSGPGVLSKNNGKFRVTHDLSSPMGIVLTTQSHRVCLV